jgi:hypothetical protein
MHSRQEQAFKGCRNLDKGPHRLARNAINPDLWLDPVLLANVDQHCSEFIIPVIPRMTVFADRGL